MSTVVNKVSLKEMQANKVSTISGLESNTSKSSFKTFSLAFADEQDGHTVPLMGVLLNIDLDRFNSSMPFKAESVEEILWFIKNCTLDTVKELQSADQRKSANDAKPSIRDMMAKR